jgi:hypothetical protein
MISTDELVAIERTLWTNEPTIYKSTLIPEALLVFAETGPITRDRAVEAIEHENAEGRRWAEVEFDDIVVSRLVDDAVLLHYRATARWAHASARIVTMASSVYVKRADAWKLAFHQQTEVTQ